MHCLKVHSLRGVANDSVVQYILVQCSVLQCVRKESVMQILGMGESPVWISITIIIRYSSSWRIVWIVIWRTVWIVITIVITGGLSGLL